MRTQRNVSGLAILLLVLSMPAWAPSASASDTPTNADVFAGDSYTRSTASAAGGLRHYRVGLVSDAATANGAHRAGWDNVAGTMFTFTYRTWTTGLSPPALPDGDGTDTCVGEILRGNSAVVHATLFTAATCPADAATFTATLSSAGTYRIRIRVVQTNELVDNYNVSSDNGGTSDKGALRIRLDVSAITHNGYPAGSTHAYTVAGETVGVTLTHTVILTDMSGSNVAIKNTDSSNGVVKSNTVALSSTSTATTFTVDDTYAASSSSYGIDLEITGTSTLTGVPWTSIGTVTSPVTSVSEFVARRTTFITVDPRVTATHLLLVNDATFATPPMSEDAGATRYNDQIGRIATRFTNSRSEGLAGASFLFSQSIQDNMATLPADTITGQAVSTQGGEAGWGPLQLWNSGAPTGMWTKTLDVTGPSAIDNNAHLVSSTASYTLSVPGSAEGGTGDPLVVELGSLVADRGDSILIGIGESFLDGTARTGNAANTYVYIYNPAQTLVVNGANPTEVQYGTYRYTYTLNSTAPYGNWLVLVRTTDPDTMDPIGANNVFNVTAAPDDVDFSPVLNAMEENKVQLIGLDSPQTWTLLFFLGLFIWALHQKWACVGITSGIGLVSTIILIYATSDVYVWAMSALLLLLALSFPGDFMIRNWLERRSAAKAEE